MARHRKRPAPRQQARGRDDSPASPEASEGRFGAAMRRVVVTPTFAAGLGVVVAALLAYPMQTVFSYVAPGAGTLSPSPPGPAEPGNDGPQASAVPQTGGSGGPAAAQPRLHYKITGKWQGGFWGQVIITFPGAVPERWRLRIGYP